MTQSILRFILIVCTLISTQQLFSQYDLKIGQWKSHLPFNEGIYVTQSEDRVFYNAKFGILSMDKEDKSVEFLSTVDGLSNVGPGVIKYNNLSDILVVSYSNSIIDLIKSDEIITITDIQRFTNISGDKRIYDIFTETDSTMLLATGYGFSRLNLNSADIVATTFTGVKLTNVHVWDGHVYISSEEGIYFAKNDGTVNLDDFGEWELLDGEEGFPDAYSTNALGSFNGKLYLDIDNTLHSWDGVVLDSIHNENEIPIRFMSSEGKRLMVGYYCVADNCNNSRILYMESDESFQLSGTCIDRPLYAVEDQYGWVWYADLYRKFRYIENPFSGACNRIEFNTPFTENSNKITIHDNEVWVASGGIFENHIYKFRNDGVFSFIDGTWGRINKDTDSELTELYDFYDVAIHPENGKVYFSSFLDGLVEYDRENYTFYDENNSTLTYAFGDIGRTRVSGLAFDEDNNLWMANHSASKPITVLKNDGSWKSFSAPSGASGRFIDVVVDQNGYKWFITGENGMVVFDEGDIDIDGDEQSRFINIGNSALENNRVKSIAVDLEGDVWVGTAEGAYVFECGSGAFDANCQGARRIVQFDGFNAYLLETEDVRTIAVDGANRKWFGTTNGVFVQSPNGEEQIATFNTINSPLFDNTIIDIAINGENGEVFMGTDKGIISLRAEAIEGGRTNKVNEVFAYPNPIRPDYDGPIAIKGLARDADVKITDVSGQMVYEGKALGGQAIWDGKDYNGQKAASGIYLVFATSTQNIEAPDAVVTKILFLN